MTLQINQLEYNMSTDENILATFFTSHVRSHDQFKFKSIWKKINVGGNKILWLKIQFPDTHLSEVIAASYTRSRVLFCCEVVLMVPFTIHHAMGQTAWALWKWAVGFITFTSTPLLSL